MKRKRSSLMVLKTAGRSTDVGDDLFVTSLEAYCGELVGVAVEDRNYRGSFVIDREGILKLAKMISAARERGSK